MVRVLIIDDEPIAQDILVEFSKRLSELKLVGICDNAIEGIRLIQKERPDLIFLDIQMPEMTGLEMLRAVNYLRAKVIFTTAYADFALEGFELDAIDYLLKPISFNRFVKAVNRAQALFDSPAQINALENSLQFVDETKKRIWVKEGRKMIQVALAEIILVEAMADYVKLIMLEEQVIIYATMSRVEQLLSPPDFLRINRSTIVRRSAIRSIEDLQVEIILPEHKRISIGPKYWDSIKASIDLWTK